MKNHSHGYYLLILLLLYACNQHSNTEFYLPAEWEPQDGIIVAGSNDAATLEMLTQLSHEEKVYCMVADTALETIKRNYSAAGINLDSIEFIISSTDFSYAARDGLLFMKNNNGERQLVNFAWNMYGWYFEPVFAEYLEMDKKVRMEYVAAQQKAFPFPVINAAMVNEGGGIESNGKGTLLQVESMNMHRNPGMTKEAQEAELKKVLNVKKVIWLKEGAAEDPSGWGTLITDNYFGIGVNGHVDQFCRFVNANTILLAFPDSIEAISDPVKKITLDRMKVNYQILQNATDQDGNLFTVVKMPVPDIEYMTFAIDTANPNDEIKFLSRQILYEQKQFAVGDTVHFVPASSYLNFLITNKTVFQAEYWTEGRPTSAKAKDEKAKQILQQYFPDKRIYQINTTATNHNGGGLHCWSMQVPR
jgi:agmatine deiminase